MEKLDGETPREKYENLVTMQRLLREVAFPGRGTVEEHITVQDVADRAQKILKFTRAVEGEYDNA
jgi:hypothetical protein